jgi:hypothetical protein
MRDVGAPADLYRLLDAADEPELIDREIPEARRFSRSAAARVVSRIRCLLSGDASSRSTSIRRCSS